MTPTASFKFAVALKADHWVPANGGTETPFIARDGKRLLWCYNPATGKHAYLDCRSDVVLTDEEAFHSLGLY
jgi:hypothetical protein